MRRVNEIILALSRWSPTRRTFVTTRTTRKVWFPVSSLYDGVELASYKRFIGNHATVSNTKAANSCRFSNAANKTKGTASVPASYPSET
jgi:hypothetical protein